MTKPSRPGQSTIPVAQLPVAHSPGPAEVPFSSAGAGFSAYIPLIEGSSMPIIVPPGGFAGFAQQTPATQAMFQRAGRTGGLRSAATRRRRKRKTAATAPKRRRKTARRGPGRRKLVKGSAAAKRYMAKIRRKRRR